MRIRFAVVLAVFSFSTSAFAEDRQLLWGDTHLHTNNSFDAFLNGNQSASPDTAYRYARGLPVIHPYNRTRVQIGTPLDFLVISDHAEFFGGIKDIYYEGIQVEDPGFIEQFFFWYAERNIRDAIDSGNGPAYFRDLLPQFQDPRQAAREWVENVGDATVPGADVSAANAWTKLRATADEHNRPGEFTAMLGWEYTPNPGGANMHRVVLTDADGEQAAGFMPFSSADSPYPEDLWRWLEKTEQESGARFVAIPHNSNISRGVMFDTNSLRGNPIDEAYARLRIRWEPVAEITQIKGDSETHPSLSPEDEFADFEAYEWWILNVRNSNYEATRGDYIRPALRTGMELEQQIGVNPFQFGVIGATDSHTGLASAEEPNFWGKMARDSIPENKQGVALTDGPTGWTMQAGGLAGVWAEENTRGAIVDAFKRREVYATTGPRISVRLFAGSDFTEEDLTADDFAARGYERGVPMGGELAAGEGSPVFMVQVASDPRSGFLDRIQMVKGWVDSDGQSHEKIFNIAWSGDRELDEEGKLPAVGDTVNRETGSYTNTIGAAQLGTVWQDPMFDTSQRAFYYVRVLQIPTPRHSQLDAIALGLTEPDEGPQVIQERAYSSPVWVHPPE